MALTLETDGNSDIYVMDLRTRAVQRLTTDPAIDTRAVLLAGRTPDRL